MFGSFLPSAWSSTKAYSGRGSRRCYAITCPKPKQTASRSESKRWTRRNGNQFEEVAREKTCMFRFGAGYGGRSAQGPLRTSGPPAVPGVDRATLGLGTVRESGVHAAQDGRAKARC